MLKATVLSVTYDGETEKNLESYFLSLERQTVQADQIVLVLDGNVREELCRIIEKYKYLLPLELYQQKKAGLSKGLNHGLKYVKNDIIIRCDTDDFSHANRFELQLRLLEKTGASVVSASIAEKSFDGKINRLRYVPVGKITATNVRTFFRNPINHNCAAFRLNDVINVGGYPSGRMEDYRLWINLLKRGYFFFNDENVLLDAFVDGLEDRRIGKDYRRAEWDLMRENSSRFYGFGFFLSAFAFILRVIFRFKIMKSMIIFAYENFLRKKL